MKENKKRPIYFIDGTRTDLIDWLKEEKKRTGVSISRLVENAIEMFKNKKGE